MLVSENQSTTTYNTGTNEQRSIRIVKKIDGNSVKLFTEAIDVINNGDILNSVIDYFIEKSQTTAITVEIIELPLYLHSFLNCFCGKSNFKQRKNCGVGYISTSHCHFWP